MRDDIHSPSNFDPAEYVYVGAFDSGILDEQISYDQAADRARLMMLLTTDGFPNGNWNTRGTCDHCGANFRYVTVWAHMDGEYIAVGTVCAEERFDLPNRVSFDIKRLKAQAASAAKLRQADDFIAAHGLAEVIEVDHYITRDILGKLRKYGSISEAQVNLLRKLHREAAERAGAAARREEETKVAAPLGRTEYEGVVIKLAEKYSDFDGSTYWKMTVKVTDEILGGVYFVHVTKPSKLQIRTGETVRMTATLSHGNDSHFAFGKRPSGAQKIDVAPVTVQEDALA
jgi:hypothetical protein